MNKSKITIGKFGKYLREISVVVIGVAITLFASYWITNSNEKRDMALYLNAVKLELKENIKSLDNEATFLEDWEKYARYLSSRDKKSIHKDSIREWGYPGLGTVHNIVFQTSAFEMYKVSGAMRLLKDKELLQSIWKSYLNLEVTKDMLDSYYKLKMDECVKANQLGLAGKTSSIPLYDFFYSYANFGALEACQESSKELKVTVAEIEKNIK